MNSNTKYRRPFSLAACSLLGLSILALAQQPTSQAEPRSAEERPKTQRRQFSDAHRFVFFAVLEGCYEDGLTKEAIDLIIPNSKTETNFVYLCPLCCPAEDAFHTYALRPRFGCAPKDLRDDPLNTFGDGLDEDVMRQLSKPGLECRNAIQSLIEKWVDARMKRMRFAPDETKSLREQLASMRKEGEALLKQFQAGGNGENLAQAYKGWTSCPICSGSSPASGTSE